METTDHGGAMAAKENEILKEKPTMNEPGKDNKSEVASPKLPQLKRTSDARVDNKKPSIAQQLEMLSKELNSEIDEEEAERDQQRLNVLTRAARGELDAKIASKLLKAYSGEAAITSRDNRQRISYRHVKRGGGEPMDIKRKQIVTNVCNANISAEEALVQLKNIDKELNSKKLVNFNDELTIHITYSPDEYDRNKPDDFDPDGNRILWDEEREEERMRQLEIRWKIIEDKAGDGKPCQERLDEIERLKDIKRREEIAKQRDRERREARRARGAKKRKPRNEKQSSSPPPIGRSGSPPPSTTTLESETAESTIKTEKEAPEKDAPSQNKEEEEEEEDADNALGRLMMEIEASNKLKRESRKGNRKQKRGRNARNENNNTGLEMFLDDNIRIFFCFFPIDLEDPTPSATPEDATANMNSEIETPPEDALPMEAFDDANVAKIETSTISEDATVVTYNSTSEENRVSPQVDNSEEEKEVSQRDETGADSQEEATNPSQKQAEEAIQEKVERVTIKVTEDDVVSLPSVMNIKGNEARDSICDDWPLVEETDVEEVVPHIQPDIRPDSGWPINPRFKHGKSLRDAMADDTVRESTSDCQNSKESEDGADDGELVLLEGPRERTTSSIRRLSNDGGGEATT
eukprot:m.49091 g.49091  ORF g.49091 m.49091 type:complete len:636 (+) comp10597_c0_seq3:169-2076(+)